MSAMHLTDNDIELYVNDQPDTQTHMNWAHHLSQCSVCLGRVSRERRMVDALRALPHENPPYDLAARISTSVEWSTVQMQTRRVRIPFIAGATFFSVLLSVWFAVDVIVALQDNGALEFLALFTSRPDLISTYSLDAVLAFIEALPIYEIILTCFALMTVIVLAQQLIDLYQTHSPDLSNIHIH